MDIIEVMERALQIVVLDATKVDALAVHKFLVENLTAGEVAIFRDEVLTFRKRDYMRTYMRSQRAEKVALRKKGAKA